MEEIGVPITEAKQTNEFKKLPDYYSKLTQLKFNPQQVFLKHVVSRKVLPVFLPEVQEKINKAKTSIQKKLAFACNNIGKNVEQIWTYLKLILPQDINLPDSEFLDFNKLFNELDYATFKLICRFWVYELENVISFIRAVFERAVRAFTQIALAAIATQENGYAEKMGFYIRTTTDVVNNMGTSLKGTKECFEHFCEWFSERLDTLVLDSSKIEATKIVTSLNIEKTEIDLFINYKSWLQGALKTMFMPSLHSFYSQMYLSSLDLSERTFEWSSKMMMEIDQVPANATFPPSETESVSLFNDFTNVLEASRDYSKFSPTTDIYIISTSLYELYSKNELTDETLERVDQLMKKISGYDMWTFLYLLYFTTKGIRMSIEELSALQSFIGNDLLNLITEERTLLASRNQKILELKEYEKLYRPFSLESPGYKALENLYRANINDLTTDNVKEKTQEILKSDNFKSIQTMNQSDMTIFLSSVEELVRIQVKIESVQQKKTELQSKNTKSSTQGYHDLLKEQEKYEQLSQAAYVRFLNAISKHAGIPFYNLENDKTLKKQLDEFRLWMNVEGKKLYASGGDDYKLFKTRLQQYFPFNTVADDDAIHNELLDLIVETLSYHDMGHEIGRSARKSQMSLLERKDSLTRWYYWGIIFAFFLLVPILYYIFPYIFKTNPTVTEKIKSITGQVVSTASSVVSSIIPSLPGLDIIWQTTKNISTSFLLRNPTWDDINPYNIYLGLISSTGVGIYASIFWLGGFKLGKALLQYIETESTWRALLRVRSIDNSPELNWDSQIEVVFDNRRLAQRLVIKETVGMGQAFISAGAETRAIIGRYLWEQLNYTFPGIIPIGIGGRQRNRLPVAITQDPGVRLLEASNSDVFIPQIQNPDNHRQYVMQAIQQNSNYRPSQQQQQPPLSLPSSGPTVTILDDEDAYK